MRPEVRETLVAADAAKLTTFTPCCRDWKDVDFSRSLSAAPTDVQIGAAGTQRRDFGDHAEAVVGFRLPPLTPDYRLEFVSYADRKTGWMRLDDRLFLRPDITYLDGQFHEVATIRNPTLCIGLVDGVPALWLRTPATPREALYVVFSPSIARPLQQVDTRRPQGPMLGVAGNAIVNSIADAQKSYIDTASMGHTGLISVRTIAPESPAPGRCVDDAVH